MKPDIPALYAVSPSFSIPIGSYSYEVFVIGSDGKTTWHLMDPTTRYLYHGSSLEAAYLKMQKERSP